MAFTGFYITPELKRWINQERDLKNELAYLDRRLQRLQEEKEEIEERMFNIRSQLAD
jgi:predicted  nucleic acid-binding Zn-ribbon protein